MDIDLIRLDNALIRFFDVTGLKVATIGLPCPAFDNMGGVFVSRPYIQYDNPGGQVQSARLYLADGSPPIPIEIGPVGSGAFLESDTTALIPGGELHAEPIRIVPGPVPIAGPDLLQAVGSVIGKMAVKGTAEVKQNGEFPDEDFED